MYSFLSSIRDFLQSKAETMFWGWDNLLYYIHIQVVYQQLL